MGDAPNLPPRLKRELSRLAPLPRSGPKFRALEEAARAAQAAVPICERPALPAFEALVARVEAAVERVLSAPDAEWPSHTERAGTLRQLDAGRCALFRGIEAGERGPACAGAEEGATPMAAAVCALAGFRCLQRLYYDSPHEARMRVLCTRFGSSELRKRIGRAYALSSRHLVYLPPEMWAHVVRFLDAESVRRFAHCSRTMHALATSRWRRLSLADSAFDGSASWLPEQRFCRVTQLTVRLDRVLSDAAFAQLAELVAATHEQRCLTIVVSRRLSIDGNAETKPMRVAGLALGAIGMGQNDGRPARLPRKQAGLLTQLPRLVDIGSVERLALDISMSARMLPAGVLAQFTSLRSLRMDFGDLAFVMHVALHLPRDLDELLIHDLRAEMASPLPTPIINFVCRVRRIECCSAADALVIIDAAATAGVLAVVVPRMECIVRGKCVRVECVDAVPPPKEQSMLPEITDVLVAAQQLYNIIDQEEDDAELHCDVWLKRFFTQLTSNEVKPMELGFGLDE